MRQNPDIVLVHYLNVPSLEESGKCSPLLCAVADRHDSVRWSQDDLLNQLKPMCRTQISPRPRARQFPVDAARVYPPHGVGVCVCTVVLTCSFSVSVHSMKCSVGSGDFSIEELVQHILDRQRTKPQPRTHTCLCNTAHGNAPCCNIAVTSPRHCSDLD